MIQSASPSCHQHPQFSDLLDKTSNTISGIGPQFFHCRRALDELALRYCEGRFHLAVHGRFNRGKSTLLNALTGEPIFVLNKIDDLDEERPAQAPAFYKKVLTEEVGWEDDFPVLFVSFFVRR